MQTTEEQDQKSKQREYRNKFRSGKQRYDIYADQDARTSIERLRKDNPRLSISDIVNQLVDAGFNALFPAIKDQG